VSSIILYIAVLLYCGTASIVLDVGRPLKFTASTPKLQQAVDMANRFHTALTPVVSLAKSARNAKKAADGDMIFT